jgi:hypothetical protein
MNVFEMKRLFGLLLALICLISIVDGCTKASAPEPVSPMPSMPSGEQMDQIWKVMQRFAPDVRQSFQRYREQLVSALTPTHRVAISEAIADYAVADHQDTPALTKRIEAILSESEREKIMAALSAYVGDQQTIAVRLGETLVRDHPDLLKGAHPPATAESATSAPQTSQAATVLANWLPTSGLNASEGTGAKSAKLSVFNYSGPNDVQVRVQMRKAMLKALSQNHRIKVGQAIGLSALSATSSDSTLSKQLDELLSPAERQRILDSFSAFLDEQAGSQAEFPRPRLPASVAFASPELETIAHSREQPDAGAVLWRALLLKGATVGFVTQ